jgi:hypothetical protein
MFVGGGDPPRDRQSTSSSSRSMVSPSSLPPVRSADDLDGGTPVNDVVRGGAPRAGMTTMLSSRRAGRALSLIAECLRNKGWGGERVGEEEVLLREILGIRMISSVSNVRASRTCRRLVCCTNYNQHSA